MINSDKFLDLFSAIEKKLRKITKLTKHASFYQLVDNAACDNPAIRHYKDDLKEYADLRNAIVHERSDGHVIAEPHEHSVNDLEKITS